MPIDFNTILIPLSAALGLSLTVERILEFISNLWERLIGLQGMRQIPLLKDAVSVIRNLERIYEQSEIELEKEKETEKYQTKIQSLVNQLRTEKNASVQSKIRSELQSIESETAWDEEVDSSVTLVEPANDPDDGKTMKRFVLQVLGFAIGIFLVHYSGVQVFSNFLRALQYEVFIPDWLDFLFTGLLIGAGSAPMHTLVRFVTTRKMTFARESQSEEQINSNNGSASHNIGLIEQVGDPAIQTLEEIPYFGGVDRSILEGIHKREKDPDMIIYHHTGMSSSSTFEDVVRVIKSRRDANGNHWMTAYHCVIMIDGTIRPFCRWDRYGNHASGFNRRSLGLAFNGNFETDPKTPCSNPDGRMGAQRPSEAQLRSGAKVVALWLYLYDDIELNFQKNILPHRQLSAKACPGNQFPYAGFEDLINYYAGLWKNSESIQQCLTEYKLKPYLYA